MKKIVFRDMTNDEQASPEFLSTMLYMLGDKYARIEIYAPPVQLPMVTIINEPDGWIVDLDRKMGLHIIDPEPSGEFHYPIVNAFSELEFGTEFAFMENKNAIKSSIEINGKEYDLLSVEMRGVKIELICEKDRQFPHFIRFLENGKVISSFLYDEYKVDLEPNFSLFEVPKDVTIVESPKEDIESMAESRKWEGKISAEAKGWALGCGAMLAEANHNSHKFLEVMEINEKNIKKQKNSLEEWWGISGRLSFFEKIEWINDKGHRKRFDDWARYIAYLSEEEYEKVLEDNKDKEQLLNEIKIVKEYYKKLEGKGLLGWDYTRYINLCRCAYVVGYITEEEAWRMIMPAAEMLQKVFSSWEDLGQNYIVGREFWSLEQTKKGGYKYEDAYQRLIDMPSSPWNKYPWDMNLYEVTISDTEAMGTKE
ncbi:MAG: DUF1266 domain-containing protein [Syntrophaceae bacterium]|nr:DUF1266 domain-containing protein [Syntrophaceae bacterium]